MPFYDYMCQECGKVFDRMIPMERRNEDQVCPKCGGIGVRKVVSTFNATTPSGAGSTESCSGG